MTRSTPTRHDLGKMAGKNGAYLWTRSFMSVFIFLLISLISDYLHRWVVIVPPGPRGKGEGGKGQGTRDTGQGARDKGQGMGGRGRQVNAGMSAAEGKGYFYIGVQLMDDK